jgi:hypothetical protein
MWHDAGRSKNQNAPRIVLYRRRILSMTETVWKCEQLRAGTVYNRVMFNTRAEAEEFAEQMGKVEPDVFWKIEAIPAKAVWN